MGEDSCRNHKSVEITGIAVLRLAEIAAGFHGNLLVQGNFHSVDLPGRIVKYEADGSGAAVHYLPGTEIGGGINELTVHQRSGGAGPETHCNLVAVLAVSAVGVIVSVALAKVALIAGVGNESPRSLDPDVEAWRGWIPFQCLSVGPVAHVLVFPDEVVHPFRDKARHHFRFLLRAGNKGCGEQPYAYHFLHIYLRFSVAHQSISP